jgi:hypothetical protein
MGSLYDWYGRLATLLEPEASDYLDEVVAHASCSSLWQ